MLPRTASLSVLLAHVRLLHENQLLDEGHVVGLALAQDGPHALDLLRLVVLVVQVAPVVIALRLLCDEERVTGRKASDNVASCKRILAGLRSELTALERY